MTIGAQQSNLLRDINRSVRGHRDCFGGIGAEIVVIVENNRDRHLHQF